MIAALAFALLVVVVVLLCAPRWWIGVLIVLTFTTFPAFIPQKLDLGGFSVFLQEVPMFLGAVYLLITRPPNRNTDWCAAGIAAVTVFGAAHGLLVGNEPKVIVNDSRSLLALALCVFIVGRIASTPLAQIALQAVKFTLWVSFSLILLGTWGIVKLSARAEDASLNGAAFHGQANVTRILGQTTELATATLAIVIALWAIRPDPTRRTIGYFIPALGIAVLAFDRSGLILIAVTLLLTPLFHGRLTRIEGLRRDSGLLRAGFIAVAGALIFVLFGLVLHFTAGVPGLSYLRSLYSAYSNRVLEGLRGTALHYDTSVLVRQQEIQWLKPTIAGHELLGNGLGFRYRPPLTSCAHFVCRGKDIWTAYYAHHFYWWAVAKVGWCGLIAYLVAFVTPVVHAIFGPGRFPLRSASAAAVVGLLATNFVLPIPEDEFGAPVLGILLGIALLRAPRQIGDSSADSVIAVGGRSAAARPFSPVTKSPEL